VETEVAAWTEYTEKVIDPDTKLGKDVAIERRKLLEVDACLAEIVAELTGLDLEEITGKAEEISFFWPTIQEDLAVAAIFAATKCQAAHRGRVQRKIFLGKHRAAIHIQFHFRRFKARRYRAATHIQAHFHGNKGRAFVKDLIKKHAAARRIQIFYRYRLWQRRRRDRIERARRHDAAVKIQAWIKGIQTREKVINYREQNAVCICGLLPLGDMIMCTDCYDFFHMKCVGLKERPKRKVSHGWRCPDCDYRKDDAIKPPPNCKVKRKENLPKPINLVRITAAGHKDFADLLKTEPRLMLSNAPMNLWPVDALHATRQMKPLDLNGLCYGAKEKIRGLQHVRERLMRHQKRYDRVVGKMLARLQGMPQDLELETPMTPMEARRLIGEHEGVSTLYRETATVIELRSTLDKPVWSNGQKKWKNKKKFELGEYDHVKENAKLVQKLRTKQMEVEEVMNPKTGNPKNCQP